MKTANPKDKKGTPASKTKITPGQRLAKLVSDKRPHDEKIRELYLIAFTREPNPRELELLLSHVRRNQADLRAAYEDVLWVLVNSEEFLFNH